MEQWNNAQPIFLQIREKLVGLILKQVIQEGEAIPSVRQTAADLAVNPLTVTKAYQALVDGNIIEKKRGLGMFVKAGAREELLTQERERFLREEWPRVAEQIKTLGLKADELLQQAETNAETGK